MSDNNFINLRCNPQELALIDALAKQRGCTRSEAVRIAIRAGADPAITGLAVDLRRLILLVEYTQAAVDIIVHREHADVAPEIEAIANERMEEFHAPR